MNEDNKKKLLTIFSEILEISSFEEVQSIRRLTAKKWDSLAHVMIVAAIESEFPISIDEEDYELLTSFSAVENILEEMGL
jgi:acyl carrier protein